MSRLFSLRFLRASFLILILTGLCASPVLSHGEFWKEEDDYKVWFYRQFKRTIVPVQNISTGELLTGVLIASDSTPIILTNAHFIENESDTLQAKINSDLKSLVSMRVSPIRISRGLDLASLGFVAPKIEHQKNPFLEHRRKRLLQKLGFLKQTKGDPGELELGIPDSNTFLPVSSLHSDTQISPGQSILFIGFPLGAGLSSSEKEPIYRAGMIASSVQGNHFLVDAMVSHGNSGSPIFVRVRNGSNVGLRMGGLLVGFKADQISFHAENGSKLELPHNSGLGIAVSPTAIKSFVKRSLKSIEN